jgi:plasmid stabilization system protein ParE
MGLQEKATPKNYEVRVSINALQNIEEITGYIAFVKQQPLNAVKVGDALFATIDHIAANPFVFRECDELPTSPKGRADFGSGLPRFLDQIPMDEILRRSIYIFLGLQSSHVNKPE